MLEGSSYVKMANDMSSGTIKKSHQTPWKLRCAHTGRDGQLHYVKQLADTRWFRCFGVLKYQARIPNFIQKLRDLPTTSSAGIDYCSGILLRPILQWYMFMNSEDLDGDALFEVCARVSKKIETRNANGRSKSVGVPGLLVGWKYVDMYAKNNDDRRVVCKLKKTSVARHEVSHILPFPTPTLVNYALRRYNGAEETFKLRFERVLEEESIELLLSSFAEAARYGIRYSRE